MTGVLVRSSPARAAAASDLIDPRAMAALAAAEAAAKDRFWLTLRVLKDPKVTGLGGDTTGVGVLTPTLLTGLAGGPRVQDAAAEAEGKEQDAARVHGGGETIPSDPFQLNAAP